MNVRLAPGNIQKQLAPVCRQVSWDLQVTRIWKGQPLRPLPPDRKGLPLTHTADARACRQLRV